MNRGREIISLVAERQDLDQFRRKNWEGTFEEYLDVVRSQPRVTRNAFERVYDMVLAYGTETYEEFRDKRVRYRFFSDPDDNGRDAVYFTVPSSDRVPAVLQATFEPGRQPDPEEFEALRAASLAAAGILEFTEPARQRSISTGLTPDGASALHAGGRRVTSIRELRPTA